MSTTDKVVQEMSANSAQRFCPNCHAELRMADKFCRVCGRKVDSLPGTPAQNTGISGSLVSGYSPVSQTRSSKLAPPELQESPVSELLSHYTSPSRTARELYFDLGNKLFYLHEYAKAAEAFQQASLANTDQPPTADILFYQALACERGQQQAQAFRVYLEAVLQAPQYLDDVLLYAHALLTPDIVLVHSTWVTAEWLKRSESLSLTKLNRAHIALLLGHIQVFLADYTGAQAQFEKAVSLAPNVVPDLVEAILVPDRLPPELVQADKESSAHVILARLFSALHCYDFALQEIGLAIQLTTSNSDAWIQAQQIKADILKASGEREAAAVAYYDLGVALYSSEKFAEATKMLDQSIELRKGYALAYWYLADAYLMLAYRTQNTEEQDTYTRKGLELWNRGFRQRFPGTDDAWTYLTRALLCEAQASLSKTHAFSYLWEAIACIERALLLNQQDAYTWTYLGRYHRLLSQEKNALEATRRAMDATKTADTSARIYALNERVIILANSGYYDEAMEGIDELISTKDSSIVDGLWAETVKAYLLVYKKNVQGAITLLDTLIQDNEDYLWAYYVRAYCYRLLDEVEPSNADYDAILKKYSSDKTDDKEYYAWAEYMRGDPEKALEIFEEIQKSPTQNVYFSLGLCYLKTGKQEAGLRNLLEGVQRTTNTRQLDDLAFDLDDLANYVQTLPAGQQKQMLPVIEQVGSAIKRQRKKLEHPRTAEGELRQALKRFPRKSEAGIWAWIGARAGLARLYLEQQRWPDAVEMYRLLLKEGDKFYEARLGLQKTADELCEAGDQALQAGDDATALALYGEGQAFIPELLADDFLRLGNLLTRLGFAHFAQADGESALHSFVEATTTYRAGNMAAPEKAISELCKTLLRDPQQYWELHDRWHEWLREPSLSEQARSDLSSALSELDMYLDEFFRCRAQQNEQSFKPVLPIVLEIGLALIPSEDSSEWALFKTYLPEMRQRIKQDIGIEALYVQIRDNLELQENGYRILLDEIPVANFAVAAGKHFCPASQETLEAIGVEHDAVIDGIDPRNGKKGCWVAPAYRQLVLDHHLEWWDDPLLYIVYHLEYILRSNLALFMGTPEVEALLHSWETEQPDSWANFALVQADTRFYFMRVLRSLVREQVPLHHWKDILQTLLKPGLANADGTTALSAVRLRIKQWLPGNPDSTQTVQVVELPAELDSALAEGLRLAQEHGDISSYNAAINQLIAFIQDAFNTRGWKLVLVIHTAELRFLIETLAPSLMILTSEEGMARAAARGRRARQSSLMILTSEEGMAGKEGTENA